MKEAAARASKLISTTARENRDSVFPSCPSFIAKMERLSLIYIYLCHLFWKISWSCRYGPSAQSGVTTWTVTIFCSNNRSIRQWHLCQFYSSVGRWFGVLPQLCFPHPHCNSSVTILLRSTNTLSHSFRPSDRGLYFGAEGPVFQPWWWSQDVFEGVYTELLLLPFMEECWRANHNVCISFSWNIHKVQWCLSLFLGLWPICTSVSTLSWVRHMH